MRLLIDLGFTILGGPAQSPPAFIREILSLPPGGKDVLADILFCRAHASPQELALALARALGRELSAYETGAIASYWDRQLEECRPLPGAKDFCRRILAAGYPFHIVSNLWRPFHLSLSRHLPKFERGAQSLLLSYQLGARKPHRAFYDLVFKLIPNEAPGGMIMIGDSWDNDIAPCLERGLTAVLLASDRCRDVAAVAARAAPNYPPGRLLAATGYDDCLEILRIFFSRESRHERNL